MDLVTNEPHIIIRKSERLLLLYLGRELLKTYHIALGSNPVGPKLKAGDGKTPEGIYYICLRKDQSKYHKSLGLSYPNQVDALRGLNAGLIDENTYRYISLCEKRRIRPPWGTPLGGEIMIHGSGTNTDWTIGCIALNDSDIDELWCNTPVGTIVTILS